MAMECYSDPKELQSALRRIKQQGKRIGFCPTMGALHAGHLSLVKTLVPHCEVRVVSVFVNPTQFNDPKDYAAYIIDLEKDLDLLRKEGVDFVFSPKAESMYPAGAETQVSLSKITIPLEGEFRPGHFTGVSTVVAALFNIVEPDVAIFGEKDFQQLRLIERMVKDLHFGIEIIRGKTMRETDGLALSSRNTRLSPDARKQAVMISKGLFAAREAFERGESNSDKLKEIALKEVNRIGEHKLDYLEIVNQDTLEKIKGSVSKSDRILVALHFSGVRLIDNVAIGT